MIFALGRFLQFLGLVLLPVALYIGMGREDARSELLLLIIGATLFFVGHLLLRGGEKS